MPVCPHNMDMKKALVITAISIIGIILFGILDVSFFVDANSPLFPIKETFQNAELSFMANPSQKADAAVVLANEETMYANKTGEQSLKKNDIIQHDKLAISVIPSITDPVVKQNVQKNIVVSVINQENIIGITEQTQIFNDIIKTLPPVTITLSPTPTPTLNATTPTVQTGMQVRVSGTVVYGPTRPVCMSGVSCTKLEANFVLIFTDTSGNSYSTQTDANGNYLIALNRGSYTITFTQQVFGQKSYTLNIQGTSTTITYNISIDSGIR